MLLNILEFEKLISKPRFERYLLACENNPTKAIDLYKQNIQKSKEMYVLLSIFEITLRNKIDEPYQSKFFAELGHENWLQFAVSENGFIITFKLQKQKKVSSME
jgi:hypothetical protein